MSIRNSERFIQWYAENIGDAQTNLLLNEIENLAMNGINLFRHEKTDKVYRFNTYFDYPSQKYNNLEDAIQQGDFILEVTLWKDN